MKWYAYVIIALVILAAVLALLCMKYRDQVKDVNDLRRSALVMYHNQIMEYNKELATRDTLIDVLKLQKDSVTQYYAAKLDAANATINRQRGQLASVAVIIEADSSEFTEAQLQLRDSLIDSQDQQIANLYGERAAIKVSTDALIEALESKSKLSEDEANKWIGRWQISEVLRQEDEKKWKRQRRRERIAEGLVVVGLIVVAL